jgi:hypothetical protein
MEKVRDATTMATITTRLREPLRAGIEASAKAKGHSLNSEITRLLHEGLQRERAELEHERSLAEAMVLAYGPDNGPLLHLIGEVVIVPVAPRGQWRDDASLKQRIQLRTARLLDRLQAPEEVARFYSQKRTTDEESVDKLLFEIGNDGSETRGPLFSEHRWAAEIRRRLGSHFGQLLVDMRRRVKEHLESKPPWEPAPSNPEHDALWERAQTALSAHPAVLRQQQEHDLATARDLIAKARDTSLPVEVRNNVHGIARRAIDWLAEHGHDAETVAALRRDLDAARASLGGEG